MQAVEDLHRQLLASPSSAGLSSNVKHDYYLQLPNSKRRRLNNDTSSPSDTLSPYTSPSAFESRPSTPSTPSTPASFLAQPASVDISQYKTCSSAYTIQPASNSFRAPHDTGTDSVQAGQETDGPTDAVRGKNNDVVCFGMIADIAVKEQNTSQHLPQFAPLVLTGSKVLLQGQSTLVGSLNEWDAGLLHAIQTADSFELQLYCCTTARKSVSRASAYPRSSFRLVISAIIYGTQEHCDDLCRFLDEHDIFLQDPIRCDRNVKYCNPQRLFPHSDDEVTQSSFHSDVQDYETPVDILSGLECTNGLQETPTPSSLKTELFRHQREALTFLLRREKGWALDAADSITDVWRARRDDGGGIRYINNIAEEETDERPQDFRGGILADAMGLGKSLTTIALIASDKDHNTARPHAALIPKSIESTLLVVRAPLLKTWEHQLKLHIVPGKIIWRLHHGTHKMRSRSDLSNTDIVVTTYNTIAAEWKKYGRNSLLFAAHWRRIVLDEAHDIRDHRRPTCKAICALEATSRWAVTGTPIQNRLLDLASLFQFLRVYPYDTTPLFQSLINQLTSKFGQETATSRLRQLVQYIMLRRSTAAVALTKRHDLISRLEFSSREQELYEKLKQDTLNPASIDLPRNEKISHPTSVLEMINQLRMVCNLGTLLKDKSSVHRSNLSAAWSHEAAQELFNSFVSTNTANCKLCGTDLGSVATEAADHAQDDTCRPAIFRCGRLVCGVCRLTDKDLDGSPSHNGEDAPFLVSNMSTAGRLENIANVCDSEMPTKIRAILADLDTHVVDEKCIVFSFWTSTLDLIEQGLKKRMIPYIRFDGTLPQGVRNKALDSFCSNHNIRVALLTISCGAVGLNLTAASRAYLMEPHWNPSVEQQALARIHRMGQTRPVTTVRYVMRNTLEDYVIRVQHEKQELSRLLLSDQSTMSSSDRLRVIQSLLSDPPPADQADQDASMTEEQITTDLQTSVATPVVVQ